MIETTGDASLLEKFNAGKLPPKGHALTGRYFKDAWEKARKEKIARLDMHARWIELHAMYRGRKRRRVYPRVGANYLFKTIESYCATLTEKVPIAEISAGDADDPMQVKAFDSEAKEWWMETEQQISLFASCQNMQLYGTTIEKCVWDQKKGEPDIIIRDPFNIFPEPGYKMCDMELSALYDVEFMYAHEIRQQFGVSEDVEIPSDGEEQVAGTSRERVRGGKAVPDRDSMHYQSHYATVTGVAGQQETLRQQTLVVEIWVRDNSTERIPITEKVPILDGMGRPAGYNEVETGEFNEVPIYFDGIRRVVICPALLGSAGVPGGVLADDSNPNINWGLLETRIEDIATNGIPVVEGIDPQTKEPVIKIMKATIEEAEAWVLERAKTCYPLWGQFPYNVTPSRVDTSQWWGFSIIEQLEELQGKAELMLTKYLVALERAMYPIFLNPQQSGVADAELSNDPSCIIHPTFAAAQYMKFIDYPAPPSAYLEALQYVMYEMDIVSMTPEVTEGRKPKGITAAAAIIALQDKAATLFQPQVWQIDKLIRNRGRMWVHFKLNFDTTAKQVKVDDEFIKFRATNLFANFKFEVESGSSAPITKAGRRQQFVELRKMGDMDRESMLDMLDVPQTKLIIERLTEEESVPRALELLVQAGMPLEWAQQIYGFVMQDQFAPKPHGGTTMPTAEDAGRKDTPKAGGYSEGINSAKQGMSELKE